MMASYTTNQVTNPSADAVRVKCPNCGHSDYYTIKNSHVPFVVCCPSDEGGCDKYFVIKVQFQAIVTTMEIKD